MNVENLMDLYTDYLIVAPGQTTATGLSTLSEGKISHDQVTPFVIIRKYRFGSFVERGKAHMLGDIK
jgi:hypothetical protein